MNGGMQTSDLAGRLRGARDAAGGWAYYSGKAPRIEPTCWASLALRDETPGRGLEGFARAGGFLVDPGSPEPNYGWNGLAALALHDDASETGSGLYAGVLSALVSAKGVQLRTENTTAIPQNGLLQAWSWTAGTFSWVEPTAYCLLALKRVAQPSQDVRARIDEAEAVLRDRVCPAGGWNYGNSAVLGQDLRAYAPTTALGLLALQDRRDDEVVRKSLAWLESSALHERSAMALSLVAITLHLFGKPVAPVQAALREVSVATGFLDNAHLMAMALYAMTLDGHKAAAFTLPRRAAGELT
jgi:hypothetical protein